MVELYVKLGLLVAGSLIVLLNLVNVPALVSKLLMKNKNPKVDSELSHDTQKDFLEIVSLWYQLKNKCDEFDLHVASTKLDEVFPLLNGVLDDQKTN
ncbi:hypothetical protein EB001_01770 [bacterium]|nr:hypothetical protein [bacterium]